MTPLQEGEGASPQATTERAANGFILVGVAAALGLGVLYAGPLLVGNRVAPTKPAPPVQAKDVAPTTFTYAEFARIERDMTSDQVADILGGPGALQITTTKSGIAVKQMVWTNQNGATATIIFADGRVLESFQVGF